MAERSPEFSRLIDSTKIGPAESRYEISATPAERAALARRFGLVALDQLAAEVQLRRLAGGFIRLIAELSAEVVQACIATEEPVPGRVAEQFSLLYGPVAEEAEVVLDGETEPVEPLTDGMIDLGESVAQQLSLALDPFPRAPDAEAEIAAFPEESEARSPFAPLKDWRKTGKPDA